MPVVQSQATGDRLSPEELRDVWPVLSRAERVEGFQLLSRNRNIGEMDKISARLLMGASFGSLAVSGDEAPAHGSQALLAAQGDDGLDDLARGNVVPRSQSISANRVTPNSLAIAYLEAGDLVAL